MMEERFESGKAPQLLVQCRGDLQIRGWAEPAILVKGDAFEASEGEHGLFVDGSSDLDLLVPAAAEINLLQVRGDLVLKGVDGRVTINVVTGDATVRSVGQLEIVTVKGDLDCRDIGGKLTLNELSGDAALRNMNDLELHAIGGDLAAANINGSVTLTAANGDVSLRTVNGDVHVVEAQRDVNLRNLGGMIKLERVEGDIRLRGGLCAGKHTLSAQGDIVVRWPMDAPLNIEAAAPRIQRRMNLLDLVEEDAFLGGRVGNGECFLILKAKGRIILNDIPTKEDSWSGFEEADFDFEFDLSGLGDRIASEVTSQVNDWSARFEREFGPEFASRIDRTAKEAAARAERAARKAENAIKKVRWQTESGGRIVSPPARPSGKRKSTVATEEEQLKILRMVENGIISPEEASTLLQAIEG
jgi:hypothetical protein